MIDPALSPTTYIDSDHPKIIAFAREAIGDARTDRDKARRLFLAVREHLRYDPYTLAIAPADYRASAVVAATSAYCIPKAVLLAAVARAAGIRAWLGFSDVKNHLTSEKLRQALKGEDLFIWHGYTAMEIEGKIVKATPAFNASLCARFGVPALEFDGVHDALLQPFDGAGNAFMDYVADRGLFDDLPLEQILDDIQQRYGVGPGSAAIHDAAFH